MSSSGEEFVNPRENALKHMLEYAEKEQSSVPIESSLLYCDRKEKGLSVGNEIEHVKHHFRTRTGDLFQVDLSTLPEPKAKPSVAIQQTEPLQQETRERSDEEEEELEEPPIGFKWEWVEINGVRKKYLTQYAESHENAPVAELPEPETLPLKKRPRE